MPAWFQGCASSAALDFDGAPGALEQTHRRLDGVEDRQARSGAATERLERIVADLASRATVVVATRSGGAGSASSAASLHADDDEPMGDPTNRRAASVFSPVATGV